MRELLFTLARQAADEAAEARAELAEHLAKDEFGLTEATATLVYRQLYARWWTTVTSHIQDGLDPITALHRSHQAAQRTLLRLDASIPCTPCPRAQDPLLILRRAASGFHHDTHPATLQSVHGIPLPGGEVAYLGAPGRSDG